MFVLCLSTACRHGQPIPITVGPAHELWVPVVIDDHTFRLQIDTGASTTTLTKAASQRAHVRFVDTSLHAAGAAGTVDKLERATLPASTLGDIALTDLTVSVIDFDAGASDGVLGMDVFRRSMIDIDLGRATLTVRSSQERGWRSDDLVELPCRVLDGGQVAISVAVDGRAATAIIDLGASSSCANALPAPHRVDATVRVITAAVGADGHPWRFRGFDDVAVSIGELAFVAPTLLVADLPIFGELGLADAPAMIIGVDLLASRRVVIDSAHRRVYVSARAKMGK
jgi:Aspartyl protease